MARLRLFANLREIAGAARLDVAADTVGQLIESVNEKFGTEFARGVESSRVWLNGEAAEASDSLVDSDEVVLLPPVSGGAQPSTLAPSDLLGFLAAAVAIVAFSANTQGQEIWAAALVAVAAVWALDLGSAFVSRGRLFATLAVIATATGAVLAAHTWGDVGYGMAVPLAVIITLIWPVAFKAYRQMEVYAPTMVVSVLAGLGMASLVLSRSSFSPDERAVDVFLVATIVGSGLGSLVARMPAIPVLDSFSATAIGAVGASVAAAAVWELDVVAYLLVGLALAVALVAGLGLSSMLRTGRVALTERPPGLLTSIDGIALAASVYYPVIRGLLL